MTKSDFLLLDKGQKLTTNFTKTPKTVIYLGVSSIMDTMALVKEEESGQLEDILYVFLDIHGKKVDSQEKEKTFEEALDKTEESNYNDNIKDVPKKRGRPRKE